MTEKILTLQLSQAVQKQLDGQFEGSINWYCTSVKLDLEARSGQLIQLYR